MFDESEVPEWLSGLLSERFFNACIIHEDAKRNEKTVFCLDCCDGICQHCFPHHRSHRVLQIRRYVYHDVVRLGDANKLMDCAHVQHYTSNGTKVVFLNQRPKCVTQRKTSAHFCIICDRNLKDPFIFCSISCKLEHLLRTGCKLSKYLPRCEFLALSEPGLDDGQMTPDSVLDPAGSVGTDSGSGSVSTSSLSECPAFLCTASTEVVRKKRSNLPGIRSAIRPGCRPVSGISRRKGNPHRSPLN